MPAIIAPARRRTATAAVIALAAVAIAIAGVDLGPRQRASEPPKRVSAPAVFDLEANKAQVAHARFD